MAEGTTKASAPRLLPVAGGDGEGDRRAPRRGGGGAEAGSAVRHPSTILRLCEASDGPPPHLLREQRGDMGRSQSADCQHTPHHQPPDFPRLPEKSAPPAPRTPARPHNPPVPSQGGAQGLAILSRRKRDEREGCLRPSQRVRRRTNGSEPATSSSRRKPGRAASVRPPRYKGRRAGNPRRSGDRVRKAPTRPPEAASARRQERRWS